MKLKWIGKENMDENLEKMFNIEKRDFYNVFLSICDCLIEGNSYVDVISMLDEKYIHYFAAIGIMHFSNKVKEEINGRQNSNN